MPKTKEPMKLPKAEDVASAKPIVEAIAKRKERIATVKANLTKGAKDAKVDKYDPKIRQAKKRLKRAQRNLHKELVRCRIVLKEKEAATAAAAPAEAPKEA